MEICTTRGAVSAPYLPLSSSRRFTSNASHLHFHLQKLPHFPGVSSNARERSVSLRAISDESSSSFTEKKSDGIVTFDNDFTTASVDNVSAKVNEKEDYNEKKQVVESFEGSESSDNEFLQSIKEFLKKS